MSLVVPDLEVCGPSQPRTVAPWVVPRCSCTIPEGEEWATSLPPGCWPAGTSSCAAMRPVTR